MRPREIVPIAIPNKVIKFCSINYKDKYSINLADDGTFVLSDLLKSCLGHKKQGFGPKINCSQMKLPNLGSPSSDGSSKIGHHLVIKWFKN